jgi:hypothetical protein
MGCTSIPQYAFMAWCSFKAQGEFYLLASVYGIRKVLFEFHENQEAWYVSNKFAPIVTFEVGPHP